MQLSQGHPRNNDITTSHEDVCVSTLFYGFIDSSKPYGDGFIVKLISIYEGDQSLVSGEFEVLPSSRRFYVRMASSAA